MNKITRLIPAFLLIAAICLLYGQFLWNHVVFDDFTLFILGADFYTHIRDSFNLLELRWMPYATLVWTVELFGNELIWLRLGNLVLHATVSVVLFWFLDTLFNAAAKVEAAEQRVPARWLAFFGALIFALHPIAVYGAAYLIQRTILMSTLFALLALLAYLKGTSQLRGRWWLLASVVFYFLSVFSKEHSIMLPLVMVALAVLLTDRPAQVLRRQWPNYLGYFLVALLALLQRKEFLGSTYEPYALEMLNTVNVQHAYPLSVLTQTWLFFKYWLLWLLPNPEWMSVDMREPFAQSLFSAYGIALVAFIIYPVVACRLLLSKGTKGLAGFGMLFPWLLFLTEVSTIRIQEPFVLYRSYLWMGGIFAILPAIFWNIRSKVGWTILCAIALFFVPISLDRLSTFSHSFLLWDDAAKLVENESPPPLGSERIYYNRGNSYYLLGKFDPAIADYRRALTIQPKFEYAYGNLGKVYLNKGDAQRALDCFNRAIKLVEEVNGKPVSAFYFGRAATFERLGNLPGAMNDYLVTCRLGKGGCEQYKKLKELQQ